MNTNTGEIRQLEELTEADKASGEWVAVSEQVAKQQLLGQRVARQEQITAIEAQLEELRRGR